MYLLFSKIVPIIKPINSYCADFPFVDTVIVQLNPVCMQDLRQIDFSKDNFYLLPVNPNPATTSAIKITYSVGYECFTEIEIYNSYGELISKPINSISS